MLVFGLRPLLHANLLFHLLLDEQHFISQFKFPGSLYHPSCAQDISSTQMTKPFLPVLLLTAPSQHKLQWELTRERDEKAQHPQNFNSAVKIRGCIESSENTMRERDLIIYT